jgi:hypothetical protein
MKIKFLFGLFFLSLCVPAAFAQSVVVTPKKTTYRRPKPGSDFKKTFTVNYPKVKAANAALSKKIEAAISYEKNLQFTIREELTEIQWLEEADFEVKYNKNDVLCINLFITGSGAYPSSSNKVVVVDLKTGNRIVPANVFTNTGGLLAKIKELQKEDIEAGIEEIKKDPESADENLDELFKETDFTAENLDGFEIDDQGLTFNYDYGFPHVIEALEPSGKYFMTWDELKPFIKPAGLLGKFIR